MLFDETGRSTSDSGFRPKPPRPSRGAARRVFERKASMLVITALTGAVSAVAASRFAGGDAAVWAGLPLPVEAVSALGGILVGLTLTTLVSRRDTALYEPDEVVAALGVPVVAAVPVMMTRVERRQLRRMRRLRAVAGLMAVVVCGAALVWVLFG